MQFATADVVVEGEDVDVALSTQTALSISGRIVFETDRAAPPALPAQLRVSPSTFAVAASGGWSLPQLAIEGGRFRMDGIVPGVYRQVANDQGVRVPVGTWWLKSLIVAGREVLDAPLELRQSDDSAVATFTDRASTVTGVVKDEAARVSSDVWVVAFATDRSGWFTNSRRVASVKPGADGRYTIRNLPPGEYRIAAVPGLAQGEWFDPAVLERLLPAATPLRIAGTESQTIDLTWRWQ